MHIANDPYPQDQVLISPYVSHQLYVDSELMRLKSPAGYSHTAQIGRGAFGARMDRIDLDGMMIFRTKSSNATVSRVGLEPSVIGFAVYLDAGSAIRFNGREIAEPCTISLPSGLPFIRSGRDIDVITIICKVRQFQSEAAALTGRDEETVSDLLGTQPLAASQTPTLTGTLLNILSNSMLRPTSLNRASVRDAYRYRLTELLMDGLASDSPSTPWKPAHISHACIASRAWEFMIDHMDKKIRLPELCREVGVGARTLQYCFNEVYGTTPVQFTKLIKLRRARSLLFESDPTTTCVKTIAYETGFTEMGRFAVEYRKQYGEAPSATLKRSV